VVGFERQWWLGCRCPGVHGGRRHLVPPVEHEEQHYSEDSVVKTPETEEPSLHQSRGGSPSGGLGWTGGHPHQGYEPRRSWRWPERPVPGDREQLGRRHSGHRPTDAACLCQPVGVAAPGLRAYGAAREGPVTGRAPRRRERGAGALDADTGYVGRGAPEGVPYPDPERAAAARRVKRHQPAG